MNKDDINSINELGQEIQILIGKGLLNKAEKMITRLPLESASIKFNVGGFYIDIGVRKSDKKMVNKGIDLIKEVYNLNLSQQMEIPKSEIYYNLANGYSSLFSIDVSRNNVRVILPFDYLNKAKKYYLEAIKHIDENVDSSLVTQIYVNYGNCLDSIGRHIEAIEAYENALNITPDYPMAIGNKGMCLVRLASNSGEYNFQIYNVAYQLIQKAINSELNDKAAKQHFQLESDYILKKIGKSNLIRNNLIGEKHEQRHETHNFKDYYSNFCLKNRLFLNSHGFYCKCDDGIGDPLAILKLILPVTDEVKPHILSSYLNQLKQEYVAARYLFVESQYKNEDLKAIDAKVIIVDTLDYSLNNIYLELLKSSFRIVYGVLDKIALFLNEYLELGNSVSKVGYKNIWYSKLDYNKGISNKLSGVKNYALLALYDIRRDLIYKDDDPSLSDIRNSLEHRFIKIVLKNFNRNKIVAEYQDDILFFDEEILVERTLELFKLVRSAIIYLVNVVYLEENKKDNQDLPTIFGIELPDNLKY